MSIAGTKRPCGAGAPTVTPAAWAQAQTGHSGIIVFEPVVSEGVSILGLDDLAYVEPTDPYRGHYRRATDPAAEHGALVEDMLFHLDAIGVGVAAVLIEPTWLASGVLDIAPRFLQVAADYVHSFGGVVLVDERESGNGRTGRSWWGFEHLGVVPDAVICGQPLHGVPVTQRLSTGRIVIDQRELAPQDREQQTRAHALGDQLGEGLRGIQQRCEHVGDVRGSGLVWALDLVGDSHTRLPMEAGVVAGVSSRLGHRDLVVDVGGSHGNVLTICINFSTEMSAIYYLLDTIEQELATTAIAAGGTARHRGKRRPSHNSK